MSLTSSPPTTFPFPSNIPEANIANLHTVDFAELCRGSAIEAHKVHEAATGYGFFYLDQHSIDYDFMFDLASSFFALPVVEKMKYDMGVTGHYFGYKRTGSLIVDEKGRPDQSEFYNISKDQVLRVSDQRLPQPDVVEQQEKLLEQFMRRCHHIVEVLVRSLGKSLGLDPDLLPSLHRVDQPSVCQARITHAPPVGADTICLGEHTDFGSITVLFNRLAGLQALEPGSHEWKYVKPKPGCAVINLGDALVQLCGNRLYSAVHRVVGPPGEQAQNERYSVVYFGRPNSSVQLHSLFDSVPEDSSEGMNADAWVANRAKNWNTANYKDSNSYRASRGTEHNVDRTAS